MKLVMKNDTTLLHATVENGLFEIPFIDPVHLRHNKTHHSSSISSSVLICQRWIIPMCILITFWLQISLINKLLVLVVMAN